MSDVIRHDQGQSGRYRALRAAIQEGLDSGVSDKTVEQIWAEAERRYRVKRG